MEDIKDSCGPSYNASLVLILGNSCQAGRNRRDEKLSLERTDGGDDLVLEVRVDKNKLGSMLYEPGRFHGALMAFDNRTGRMREITDAHDFAAIGKVIQARR